MRIKIKNALSGSAEELDIEGTASVSDLKDAVTKLTGISAHLLHCGRPLRDHTVALSDIRLRAGDSVVLVPVRRAGDPVDDPTPPPSRQAVAAATGGTVRRPARVVVRSAAPMLRNPYAQFRHQLQELMNTLMGLHQPPPGTSSAADVDMPDLVPATRPSSSEPAVPPASTQSTTEPATAQPPGPVAPAAPAAAALPEVDPALLKQLTEMGFGEWPAKKALILNRMNVQYAMEWLLEHSDDPNLNDPLPPALINAIAAPSTTSFVPDEQATRSLVDMGFSSEDVAQALRVTNNNQEAAAAWLLGDRELPEEGVMGLSPEEASIVGSVLQNPQIQASLGNPRVMEALRNILADPESAVNYASDPEIAPVLLSLSNMVAGRQ